MERPIHTKFDILACILTLNNTTNTLVIGPQEPQGTSHISQISKLRS